MKFLKDINVFNKRVLVRADFNVALDDDGNIVDDFRIRATLPTVKYLTENGARVILMSHLGKPKGEVVKRLSMKKVGDRLSECFNIKVKLAPDCIGDEAEQVAKAVPAGGILLLENLRFHKEEEENGDGFARELAKLGEIYVNDAFGVSHRSHASVVAITKYLPSYVGFLMEKEIASLSRVLENPKRPLVVVIGGAKISTKIKVIKRFMGISDNILLGGALANTVLHAKGIAIGKSLIEEDMVGEVQGFQLTDTKLHIPVDAIASADRSGRGEIRTAPVGKTREDELILDIGPETEELFTEAIKGAGTIVWNGPMGLLEVKEFAHGTEVVARAVAAEDCFSVVGGGETTAYLNELGLIDKFSHVSTGGGSMLDFLAGEEMPSLNALEQS